MRTTVDANILIYSVATTDPRQSVAIDILRRLAASRGVLVEQCLFEFLHATTRKLGSPLSLAIATVASWASNFEVAIATPDTLSSTIALLARHKLSVWDARILAVCAGNDIEVFVSEDLQDGARYGGVLVVNPFLSSNMPFLDKILPP